MAARSQAVAAAPQESYFVRNAKIPEKKCFTDLTIKKIAMGTLTGLELAGGAAIVTLMILGAPLDAIGILCIACLTLIYLCMLYLVFPHELFRREDLEDPEVFKKVLKDVNTLPLFDILRKYNLEELRKYGVIDQISYDSIQLLLKQRRESLLRLTELAVNKAIHMTAQKANNAFNTLRNTGSLTVY